MNMSQIPKEFLEYVMNLSEKRKGCYALKNAFSRAFSIISNLTIGISDPLMGDPFMMKVRLEGRCGDVVVTIPSHHPELDDVICKNAAKHIDNFINAELAILPGFPGHSIPGHSIDAMNFVRNTLTEPCYFKDSDVLDSIRKELNSRGDYEIDIPKLVDKLFTLGLVKAKEEKPISEEEDIPYDF